MTEYRDITTGIVFSNYKNIGNKVAAGPVMISGLTGTDPEDGTGIVNIADIDWNGAVLPNANLQDGKSMTINTTADLLKLVNEMQKEIYVLSAAVIALSQTV